MGKKNRKTRRELREKNRLLKQQKKEQNKQMEVKQMDKKITNYTTTTSSTSWSAHVCHTGQKKVFTTTGGIDVYAGGRNRSGGWWNLKVPIDLAMGPDETMKPYSYSKTASTTVPEGWSCDQFVGRSTPPKYMIELDFPDFGVPQVEDYFWYALHDDIVEFNIKSISTQCAGGHGRTGVQLCILYYLLNDDDVKSSILDAGQLIQLIRDLHCEEAVETDEQQRYIARILNIPFGEKVIFTKNNYTWPTYGGDDKGKAHSPNPTGANLLTTTTTSSPSSKDAEDMVDAKYPLTYKHTVDDVLFEDDEEQDFDSCDCCGDYTYDTRLDTCSSCLWTLPSNNVKVWCVVCRTSKSDWHFLSHPDNTCISCEAAEAGIKHTDDEVFCSYCQKMKYNDMVKDRIGINFICLACEGRR